jgi:hypothetical protein
VVLGAVGAASPIALGTEAAEDGLKLLDRLAEIDPLHAPYYRFQRAFPLYFAGRYAEAATALRKLPQRWFDARLLLALSLAQAGEAADGEVKEIIRLDPGFSAEAWIAPLSARKQLGRPLPRRRARRGAADLRGGRGRAAARAAPSRLRGCAQRLSAGGSGAGPGRALHRRRNCDR